MRRSVFLGLVGLLTAAFAVIVVPSEARPPARKGERAAPRSQGIADPPWLRAGLETIRRKHDVPSLSAALVIRGRIVAASAVGVRKAGGRERVTRDDRYVLMSV